MMNDLGIRLLTVSTLLSIGACQIIDDEPAGGPGTGGAMDDQACTDQFMSLLAQGCPPGYSARILYDGGSSTVIGLDDPSASAGLGLIQFGAGADADWVGYGIWQNATCTVGCLGPQCPDSQYGCFASSPEGGLCGYYCTDQLDQKTCVDLILGCEAGTGGDGGLDDTGGMDTGELDGTGGAGGEGGVVEDEYDCALWQPGALVEAGPDGEVVMSQAALDEIVLEAGAPLVECDGVRLRAGPDGYWVLSKMRPGLLSAAGFRIGDQLRSLDGVELRSLESAMEALGAFVDEDGAPRTLSPSHPGFQVWIRREGTDVVFLLRVGNVGGE